MAYRRKMVGSNAGPLNREGEGMGSNYPRDRHIESEPRKVGNYGTRKMVGTPVILPEDTYLYEDPDSKTETKTERISAMASIRRRRGGNEDYYCYDEEPLMSRRVRKDPTASYKQQQQQVPHIEAAEQITQIGGEPTVEEWLKGESKEKQALQVWEDHYAILNRPKTVRDLMIYYGTMTYALNRHELMTYGLIGITSVTEFLEGVCRFLRIRSEGLSFYTTHDQNYPHIIPVTELRSRMTVAIFVTS